jgi:hypothetical protein
MSDLSRLTKRELVALVVDLRAELSELGAQFAALSWAGGPIGAAVRLRLLELEPGPEWSVPSAVALRLADGLDSGAGASPAAVAKELVAIMGGVEAACGVDESEADDLGARIRRLAAV